MPHFIDRQLAGAWSAGERLFRGGPWHPGTPQQGYQLPYTPAELFRTALTALRERDAQAGTPFARRPPAAQDGSSWPVCVRRQPRHGHGSETALPIRRWESFHPGTGLGGAMVHWNGQTYRFQESDFQLKTRTIEPYGRDFIQGDITPQDWGVSAAEMERHYDRFEDLLGTNGRAGKDCAGARPRRQSQRPRRAARRWPGQPGSRDRGRGAVDRRRPGPGRRGRHGGHRSVAQDAALIAAPRAGITPAWRCRRGATGSITARSHRSPRRHASLTGGISLPARAATALALERPPVPLPRTRPPCGITTTSTLLCRTPTGPKPWCCSVLRLLRLKAAMTGATAHAPATVACRCPRGRQLTPDAAAQPALKEALARRDG